MPTGVVLERNLEDATSLNGRNAARKALEADRTADEQAREMGARRAE